MVVVPQAQDEGVQQEEIKVPETDVDISEQVDLSFDNESVNGHQNEQTQRLQQQRQPEPASIQNNNENQEVLEEEDDGNRSFKNEDEMN